MPLSDEVFNSKVTAVYDGTEPLLHPGQGILASERDKVTIPKGHWDLSFGVGGLAQINSRSKTQIRQKTNDRIVLEPIFNHFVKVNVKNNPLITDAHKIEWGVHIDSLVRHVIGEGPAEFPNRVAKDLNTPLHVKWTSKSNTEATSIALPVGVDRCDAFVYVFMNEDPAHPTPEPTSEGQFSKRAETSNEKMDIPFTVEEKGKRVEILLQYFNKKGHGPSSEMIESIVP